MDPRTTDAFTVTWSAPTSQMFTGYKVTISEGENSKTETPAKDATSVDIMELTAGTEYNILVVAVNNLDESSELTDTAFTSKRLYDYSYVFVLFYYYYVNKKRIGHSPNNSKK